MPPFCEVFAPVFLRAMATIVVAEISMSLDNVLGVAGATQSYTLTCTVTNSAGNVSADTLVLWFLTQIGA